MEHGKEFEELKRALSDIGRFIKKGRKNLATNSPEEIIEKYIPDSTLELEAIISGTEKASNIIMDVCDELETAAKDLDDEARKVILAHTARIFAACGFQDITGQRATKVISYLAQVEAKTLILIKSLKEFFDKEGTLAEEYAKPEDESSSEESDASLLNGPQLEGKGLTQEEVDRMLNDF